MPLIPALNPPPLPRSRLPTSSPQGKSPRLRKSDYPPRRTAPPAHAGTAGCTGCDNARATSTTRRAIPAPRCQNPVCANEIFLLERIDDLQIAAHNKPILHILGIKYLRIGCQRAGFLPAPLVEMTVFRHFPRPPRPSEPFADSLTLPNRQCDQRSAWRNWRRRF
ncbi:MAG: hypothetical protein KPEEDBHJ_01944 [Anaerolineales bacterium]|nr:hypothetical protein [Anaerolineales bacterium]